MAKLQIEPRPFLFPIPAVMVSCALPEQKPNIITIAWVGTVCSEPPMVSISIQPRRYSHSIVWQSREFVVNIPSADQVEAVDYCGLVSGRDEDKFTNCGLTPLPGEKVAAPLIKECPVNLECKVKHILNLGSHDLFIGEIVSIHHDESVMERGRINLEKVNPLAFAPGQYWDLNSLVAKQGISHGKK